MIRCAANPALQCLTLRLPVGSFAAPRGFDVPSAVFHLPSLKVLRLRLPGGESARIDWPATAFLPSLETLDLAKTNLRLDASDAISNSCPALKYWRMSFESGTPQLRVKCPLLEAFEIRTRAGPMGGLSICGCNIKRLRVRQYCESGPAYLKLSAPALQTLEWLGPLPHSAAVDSLPDSLASSLTLWTGMELLRLHENRLLNGDLSLLGFNRLLLPHCAEVEEFGEGIFHRFDQLSPIAWVHENLKHLELACFFGGFSSLALAFLLKNFSKLETLHVSCVKESYSDYYVIGTYFPRLFKMQGSFGRGGYWDSLYLSPKQLVQVTMHDFSGERFEYDFLEFLPRVATSLRMITISADMKTTPYFSEIVLEKVEQLQQSFPHITILLQLHGR